MTDLTVHTMVVYSCFVASLANGWCAKCFSYPDLNRPVVPFYLFGGEGTPTQIDYRKTGTLIPTSLVEDLVILTFGCVLRCEPCSESVSRKAMSDDHLSRNQQDRISSAGAPCAASRGPPQQGPPGGNGTRTVVAGNGSK